MLIRNIAVILSVAILLSGCKEEPEITASIVGKWNGQEVDFKVNPAGIIPAFTLNEDEFPVQLEFKNDGSLILTDSKNATHNGTYTHTGTEVAINIDYTFKLIDFSGVYDIQTLTNSNLEAEIEKEGHYTHPDTGQEFDGKVTTTLYFSRITN